MVVVVIVAVIGLAVHGIIDGGRGKGGKV